VISDSLFIGFLGIYIIEEVFYNVGIMMMTIIISRQKIVYLLSPNIRETR